VDVLWPEYGLVVELDGRAYHARASAFERDPVRDAILQRHGLRVLCITYQRLRDEPQAVIDDIKALCRLAAA
jgi:very-short-patch-repair endonuclease